MKLDLVHVEENYYVIKYSVTKNIFRFLDEDD